MKKQEMYSKYLDFHFNYLMFFVVLGLLIVSLIICLPHVYGYLRILGGIALLLSIMILTFLGYWFGRLEESVIDFTNFKHK